MQRPKVGVSVALTRGRRVLMGKRYNSHGSGTWSFPGGHLEPGESVVGCAVREVREETGLELTPGTLRVGPYTEDVFMAEELHYITLFVFAGATGDPVTMEPTKCNGWEWFDVGSFPSPLFLPIENLIKGGSLERIGFM